MTNTEIIILSGLHRAQPNSSSPGGVTSVSISGLRFRRPVYVHPPIPPTTTDSGVPRIYTRTYCSRSVRSTCLLRRKNLVVSFGHNCPRITQLFSTPLFDRSFFSSLTLSLFLFSFSFSLSVCFIPLSGDGLFAYFLCYQRYPSLFFASLSRRRQWCRFGKRVGRSISRIRTENRSRSGGSEAKAGVKALSPCVMGPAGPKLFRYRVDYFDRGSILTRKRSGLSGGVGRGVTCVLALSAYSEES